MSRKDVIPASTYRGDIFAFFGLPSIKTTARAFYRSIKSIRSEGTKDEASCIRPAKVETRNWKTTSQNRSTTLFRLYAVNRDLQCVEIVASRQGYVRDLVQGICLRTGISTAHIRVFQGQSHCKPTKPLTQFLNGDTVYYEVHMHISKVRRDLQQRLRE